MANIGHVEKHQGDANQGIDNGGQFPQIGFGRQVSITCNYKKHHHKLDYSLDALAIALPEMDARVICVFMSDFIFCDELT